MGEGPLVGVSFRCRWLFLKRTSSYASSPTISTTSPSPPSGRTVGTFPLCRPIPSVPVQIVDPFPISRGVVVYLDGLPPLPFACPFPFCRLFGTTLVRILTGRPCSSTPLILFPFPASPCSTANTVAGDCLAHPAPIVSGFLHNTHSFASPLTHVRKYYNKWSSLFHFYFLFSPFFQMCAVNNGGLFLSNKKSATRRVSLTPDN
mmetsp:Transcript_11097/g.29128  ORF Transcript_11097/g.29128 Transcript_11097/m.29128 type:complete len:204 (-) Transcript_11097:337-948(-)